MKIILALLFMAFLLIACNPKKKPDFSLKKSNDSILVNQLSIDYESFVGKSFNNAIIHSSYIDSVEIKHFIRNDRLFILYFSQYACLDCINSTFKAIEISKQKNALELIIITDFLDDRILYTLMKQHNMELPYFGLGTNTLGFNGNEFPGPFLVLLDDSLVVKRVLPTTFASSEQINNFLNFK